MRKESKNLCIGSIFSRRKYPHEVLSEAGGFLQIKLLESFAKVKDQKFGRSSKFLVKFYLSLRLVRRAGRAGKLCGLCDFLARWCSEVIWRLSRWYLGQANRSPGRGGGSTLQMARRAQRAGARARQRLTLRGFWHAAARVFVAASL